MYFDNALNMEKEKNRKDNPISQTAQWESVGK